MNVVVLAVELDQLRIEVLANTGENNLHGIQVRFLEHITPVFCYKDQVNMQGKYAVPTMPNIAICFARPSHD